MGPAELLSVNVIECDQALWFADDLGQVARSRPVEGSVQIRAHGEAVAAQVTVGAEGTLIARLTDTTLRGVAAGQSLVLYDGTRVLAQGTVKASRREP